jgi:hypothetical protein
MRTLKLLLACALLLAVGFAAATHHSKVRHVGMVIGIKPEKLAQYSRTTPGYALRPAWFDSSGLGYFPLAWIRSTKPFTMPSSAQPGLRREPSTWKV